MLETNGRLQELLDLQGGAPAVVAEPEKVTYDFLLFELAGVTYALKAQHVEEVIAWRRPFPLPRADQRVLGIIQDRGRIVVVMAKAASDAGGPPLRILVCRTHRDHIGFCADKTRYVAAGRVCGDLKPEAVLDTSEGVVTDSTPDYSYWTSMTIATNQLAAGAHWHGRRE